ncbi:MAG: hypothetical protein KAQ74_07165, partial [Dehalococcoidia bacterium]|nr:hypothetical protein [Dehalococcoidia bacterium]
INVVIRPDVYERHRQICIFNPVLVVEGTLQKKEGTLNVRADTICPVVLGKEESLPKRSRNRRKPLSQTG